MEQARDHLFINYATEDFRFVDWLCLRLVREGYLVWCDRLKLLGGESYPTEIDVAMKERSFRLLAVLSKSSINKDNPKKERTAALNLGKQRNEQFLIPLNLDGLKPTDLDWMQSDLTFIPFADSWFAGLSQLLKKLEKDGAPKSADAPLALAQQFEEGVVLESKPEQLWTNLFEVTSMPKDLFRYDATKSSNVAKDAKVLATWPFFRESSSACWSFEPPSTLAQETLGLQPRGKCENWQIVEGPDSLDIFNTGKKVINRSIQHKLLASGFVENDRGDAYYPSEERVPFQNYSQETKLKLGGVRNFWVAKQKVAVRYHLSVYGRAFLGFAGKDFIQLLLRLHLAELDGSAITGRSVQSRRKKICQSWWNHQWISRLMAVASLIANGSSTEIVIGNGGLKLSRYPTMLEAPVGFDEGDLTAQKDAVADTEPLDRENAHDEEEIIEEDEQEED